MKTILLKPYEDKSAIKKAADIIKKGGLVAIPTETVYGLAANAFDTNAVKRIFKAKGRPQDNPLIVHIAEFDHIHPLVSSLPKEAELLAERFWPGPLTLVLPKSPMIPDIVSAGLDTLAVRIPSQPIARAIIRESGLPLAAPSANISGFPSPTSLSHVLDDMKGRIPAIVDGGDCDVGIESTVLSLAGEVPTLLRPGKITLSQLREVIGEVKVNEAILKPLEEGAKAESPGMSHRHYAPKAEISVIKGSLEQFAEYVNQNKSKKLMALCLEGEEKHIDVPTLTMGREDDPFSQAQNLFSSLRKLDELGAKKAFARCPSDEDIGLAICNRLFRAAEFRIIDLTKD